MRPLYEEQRNIIKLLIVVKITKKFLSDIV